MVRFWGSSHTPRGVLSAYLDGQATLGERAQVEAHLQACARCLQEFQSLRSTVALVRSIPQAVPSRSFVISPIEVHARVRVAHLKALRLGAVAALGSLALLVAVDLGLTLPTGRTAGAPAVPQGMANPPGVPTTRDTAVLPQPRATAGDQEGSLDAAEAGPSAVSPGQPEAGVHAQQPQLSQAEEKPSAAEVSRQHTSLDWWPLEAALALVALVLGAFALVPRRRTF